MNCRQFLANISIKNVWVFITDLCNLDCDYCFFKYRKNARTLSEGQIENLLSVLPKTRLCDIVVSGGEPLIVWDKVRYLFDRASEVFPRRIFTVQSNMYLWDDEKVDYVKQMSISVEPGLDGMLEVNQRHRLGITPENYARYLANIRLIIKAGVDINPTMTVHPDEVSRMKENFWFLVEQGFRDVEVHPAFLAPWSEEAKEEFLRNYKDLLLWELKARKERRDGWTYIGKMYSYPTNYGIDLVVQPNGKVIPNWTLLSFPDEIRDKFVIMEIKENGCRLREEFLLDYLKRLREFFKTGQRTYRNFSNFNAQWAIDLLGDERLRRWFQVYKDLTEEIIRLEQPIVIREVMYERSKIRGHEGR